MSTSPSEGRQEKEREEELTEVAVRLLTAAGPAHREEEPSLQVNADADLRSDLRSMRPNWELRVYSALTGVSADGHQGAVTGTSGLCFLM